MDPSLQSFIDGNLVVGKGVVTIVNITIKRSDVLGGVVAGAVNCHGNVVLTFRMRGDSQNVWCAQCHITGEPSKDPKSLVEDVEKGE